MIKKYGNKKMVKKQEQWGAVSAELEQESLKLQTYDHTLIPLLGDVSGKRILDYGAGPGILASVLAKQGANVKVFDICKKMRALAGLRIGAENVYELAKMVPEDQFDFVICNLVLCIVPEEEVTNIARNIRRSLNDQGVAYIGFCNPRIFDVPESQLDFRKKTGRKYEENHEFMKIKKEGNYEILELHRPIEWYVQEYRKAGLDVAEVLFTPEYELKGKKIQDFVLFKLTRGGEAQ
jgi:2-polyprenyl-3-methyl-5-hydroxy-6-metoxy-1,4-benzoquinol methylase